MYKYYSVCRPVSIGTIPESYTIKAMENYDNRTFIPELNREAWSVIDFNELLSDDDEKAYELIPSHLTVIAKAYRATSDMWDSGRYSLDEEMTTLDALRAIVKYGKTVVHTKKIALWLHRHGVQVQADKENECWICK